MRNLILCPLIILVLASCAAPTGLQNFHEVEQGRIYRSAQPDEEGYKLLQKQGIRTVVKLNTERSDEEDLWALHAGIQLISIPLSGIEAPDDYSEDRIQRELSNQIDWPILIHCEWGKDRTGLAIALYRVHEQLWDPEAAHKEWLELGHSPLLFGMDRYFEQHKELK